MIESAVNTQLRGSLPLLPANMRKIPYARSDGGGDGGAPVQKVARETGVTLGLRRSCFREEGMEMTRNISAIPNLDWKLSGEGCGVWSARACAS